MRYSSNKRRSKDREEESVFISMTDLTVSFLFIVILLLAFFASQYSESEVVPLDKYESVVKQNNELTEEKNLLFNKLTESNNLVAELQKIIEDLKQELKKLKKVDPLETYINSSLAERKKILEQLRESILVDFPDFDIYLSEESDAFRFQGDGLFRSGASSLRPDRRPLIETVASRLEELLPCYTLGNDRPKESNCNQSFALIEAVQIEGHTDTDGADMSNLILSTSRANETFRLMVEKEPGLIDHLNFRKQPVLSVAGYGEMRPVADNMTIEGKASNRRIDLRMIMYVPVDSKEIEKVKSALGADLILNERD